MGNKILVTDSLFIFDEHVKQLEAAGFEVERPDKPQATEEELREAVKGKAGYILGGIEQVTEKVIDAADELKAIVFTGTGYKGFIPAHEYATKKGIAIANAPYANASAVAEWLVAAALAMNRNLFALGRTGDKTFQTTHSLSELQVGVIGLGHVGAEVLRRFMGLGAKKVIYWSRKARSTDYEYSELDELLKTSDIVCLCVADEAGHGFIGEKQISAMKQDALLVSISHAGVIDENALLEAIKSRKLRAALDNRPKSEEFKALSLENFYCSNESTAYNTREALKTTSDMATATMINLLTKGEDEYKVNL